uniref:Serine aminopeptidase S33 domain-containing protein n=1 Tax=Kalanchoe fedtschenkoi TaxID=63787 RepID=A0A7N0U8W7_KALFE
MEQLVNFIIRPPRAEYDPKNDLLEHEFMLRGKWFQRKDIEIKNSRGDVLQCSHYVPIVTPNEKPLPCVIYCHGNSGCRADASEAAIILLPSNITVFTLDFSGSGLSGGEHVTLGWNEKDDLKVVVDYLRADGNVSMIGLWGRSMGAVTSLMYGAEDPSIAGMVLDSPFSDLVDLMMELVDTYKFRFPKFTVKFAIQYMRKTIMKKANFDIMDLNTIKVAKSSFVPVLLGHAIDDDFINPHHSDRIFEAYVGDKNIIKFDGDHNSPRPQFYFDSINIFFHNVLQPPEDDLGATYIDTTHDYFDKDSWNVLHGLGYVDHESFGSSRVAAEATTTSTEEAINQLRSKRAMSRMEVPSDLSPENTSSGAQDGGRETSLSESSSKMISFELSNGNPYGPHVPTSIDDDQYVEYALDDVTYFPTSAEDEEQMVMRAVMESLRDLEMAHPREEEETSPVADTDSMSATAAKEREEFSSTAEDRSETTTACTSSSNNQDPTPGNNSARAIQSDASPQSAADPETTGTSNVHVPADGQSPSSSTDPVDNTRATLTVEKSPTATDNIIDGLMNFFRKQTMK